MKAVWTTPALRHLEQIGDFYAQTSIRAAMSMVERILDRADVAAAFPEIGRLGRVRGTRELIVTGTPFLIAYRATRGRPEIIAVFHGVRKWPETF